MSPLSLFFMLAFIATLTNATFSCVRDGQKQCSSNADCANATDSYSTCYPSGGYGGYTWPSSCGTPGIAFNSGTAQCRKLGVHCEGTPTTWCADATDGATYQYSYSNPYGGGGTVCTYPPA